MFEKSPSSEQVPGAKRTARKRVAVGTRIGPEILDEPKPDWKHPWEAPFYCFSDRYVCSAQAWSDAVQSEVQRIIEGAHGLPSKTDPELIGEWSFGRDTNAPRVWITAMGIQTTVQPGLLRVMPWAGDGPSYLSEYTFDRWLICYHGKEILEESAWDFGDEYNISADQRSAMQWHRWLLQRLFQSWEESFVRAIRRGAAHIMARKHSVLAPFERITWNQWQFFQLDKNPSQPQPRGPDWGDPGGAYELHLADVPWTATGPAGEELYEIHIAPGIRGPLRQRASEEEVIDWLVDLLTKHPDEPPQPLKDLRQFAMRQFPGLPGKGFDYCYLTVCPRTGNYNWSKPGRRKSPRKPLQPPQSRRD